MRFARFRLILAAVLFLGWLGWLGYLAVDHAKAVVVSHSQLLVAGYVIVGEITVDASGKPSPDVKVVDSSDAHALPKGTTIAVENLDEARLPSGKPLSSSGVYLLLLAQTGTQRFQVTRAPKPTSPEPGHPPVIYPWTDEVERQVRGRLEKENPAPR
jgi:hypothetical protein